MDKTTLHCIYKISAITYQVEAKQTSSVVSNSNCKEKGNALEQLGLCAFVPTVLASTCIYANTREKRVAVVVAGEKLGTEKVSFQHELNSS